MNNIFKAMNVVNSGVDDIVLLLLNLNLSGCFSNEFSLLVNSLKSKKDFFIVLFFFF